MDARSKHFKPYNNLLEKALTLNLGVDSMKNTLKKIFKILFFILAFLFTLFGLQLLFTTPGIERKIAGIVILFIAFLLFNTAFVLHLNRPVLLAKKVPYLLFPIISLALFTGIFYYTINFMDSVEEVKLKAMSPEERLALEEKQRLQQEQQAKSIAESEERAKKAEEERKAQELKEQQEAERLAAEKNEKQQQLAQKIVSSLKNLPSERDEMEDDYTWYFNTYLENYTNRYQVYPYMTVYGNVNSVEELLANLDEFNIYMKLRYSYTDDSWLFVEDIEVKSDNYQYTIDLAYDDWKRDAMRGGIAEWTTITVDSSNAAQVADLASSSKTLIRLYGDTYKDDRYMTAAEKSAIKQIYDVYIMAVELNRLNND